MIGNPDTRATTSFRTVNVAGSGLSNGRLAWSEPCPSTTDQPPWTTPISHRQATRCSPITATSIQRQPRHERIRRSYDGPCPNPLRRWRPTSHNSGPGITLFTHPDGSCPPPSGRGSTPPSRPSGAEQIHELFRYWTRWPTRLCPIYFRPSRAPTGTQGDVSTAPVAAGPNGRLAQLASALP